MDKFNIIRDTREKEGRWSFEFYDECKGICNRALKTGDYSIEGLEDIVCIERKRNTAEIAMNLGKKSKQFKAELERMEAFKYRFIICEFSLETFEDFPERSTIPFSKWKYLRVSSNFLITRFHSWLDEHGVKVIYANNRDQAEASAMEIFKKVYSIVKSDKKIQE